MTDRLGGVRAALDDLDLTNPVDAFAYGLAMGQAIEREAVDLEDDLVHRAAVRDVRVLVDKAGKREVADAAGDRSGDHRGGRVSSWGSPVPEPTGAYSR